MQRRFVLAGLAAAAAGPALAQTIRAEKDRPAPVEVKPSPAPGGMPRAAAMGETERQHMQKTLAVGTVALQTSEIALQKAQDPKVRQFAEFERAEQTTVAEVLRSMVESAATASTGAAPAPPPIPADKAAMMQKLQQAKPGPDFDRDYIDGQVKGHHELLAIQEDYLKAGHNREAVNVSKLARTQIKEHLALLADIQKQLRG